MSELLDLAAYRQRRATRRYARAVGAELWLPEDERLEDAVPRNVVELSARRREDYRKRIEDRRQHILVSDGFNPAGIVSCWLRNATLSGQVASAPDLINPSNPALQSTIDRRPDGNADGSMQFLTNDVLVWPLIDANNGTQHWLWGAWVEHDANAIEYYCNIFNLTNGASATKLEFWRHTNGSLRFDIYTSAGNGVRFTTTASGLVATDPVFVMAEFCATQSGDSNQVVISTNGTVRASTRIDIGTPAALSGGLTAGVTGNMCIGNRRDAITASAPFGGRMGRSILCGSSGPMAGVTQGLLTPDARLNLMTIDQMV